MKNYINVQEFLQSGSLIEPGKSTVSETEYNAMTPEGKALYAEQKPEKTKEPKNDVTKNIQA